MTPGELASWVAAGERLGFVKYVEPVRRLVNRLAEKADMARWNAAPSAGAMLELCLCLRIAADVIS